MSGVHSHGVGYVETRPGVCRWTHHHEDVELSCDRNDMPGTGRCVRHYLADRLGITEAHAALLLADYAAAVRERMTGEAG